ncbi:MAG: hypothetical protein ACOYU0_01765 [Nitrospirota bacterium]
MKETITIVRTFEKAKKAFGESTATIESFGKILKEMGKKLGLKVVTGDEM